MRGGRTVKPKAADDPDLDTICISEHCLLRFVQRTSKRYLKHAKLCTSHRCQDCEKFFSAARGQLAAKREHYSDLVKKTFYRSHEVTERFAVRMHYDRYFQYSRYVFVVSMKDVVPTVVTFFDIRPGGLPAEHDERMGNRKVR